MALTLFLADDHKLMREGLAKVLQAEPDFVVLDQAGDGLETIRRVAKLQPDVLVLDILMPSLTGLDVVRQVARKSPGTRIVMLSMYDDLPYVAEARRNGAMGYVVKTEDSDKLIETIRTVVQGKPCMPIPENVIEEYLRRRENGTQPDPYQSLTNREREILQMTAEGKSGPEISGKLFISPRTVETHRNNVMRKLGVRNLKELISYAMQRGLVTMPAPPGPTNESRT